MIQEITDTGVVLEDGTEMSFSVLSDIMEEIGKAIVVDKILGIPTSSVRPVAGTLFHASTTLNHLVKHRRSIHPPAKTKETK